MEMCRRAYFRNRPGNVLVGSQDEVRKIARVESGVLIRVVAKRLRHSENSYQYEIVATPEEVLRCLCCLSQEQIQEAVKQVGDNCEPADLGACVSRLVEHLTKAGMSALVPTPANQDDNADDLFREIVPASQGGATCFDPFAEV